jgi:hypothetical protein
MAWIGMMLSGGGLYVIYQNKVEMGKDHFTTLHSWGEFGIDWWCFVVIVERGKLFRLLSVCMLERIRTNASICLLISFKTFTKTLQSTNKQ